MMFKFWQRVVLAMTVVVFLAAIWSTVQGIRDGKVLEACLSGGAAVVYGFILRAAVKMGRCEHLRERLVGTCWDLHVIAVTVVPAGIIQIKGETGKVRCLDCGRVRLAPAEEVVANGMDL